MPKRNPDSDRIAAVRARPKHILCVSWRDGREDSIDLSSLISCNRHFTDLKTATEFKRVDPIEGGWGVEWACGADLSNDTLKRLADEQAGRVMRKGAFKAWRKTMGLTLDQTAQALALGRRTVAAYDNDELSPPRTVMLATRALAAGLDGTNAAE